MEELEIDVQSFLILKGKGRLKATKDNLSRKKSMICIKNTDTMCAVRAIVTAVSVLNKDRWTSAELQSFRKSKKVQEREALKHHQDSGVPVKDEGNDFADLKKFAQHLKVGLKVFSGNVFGEICFETGELNDQTVCLLKNGTHFDVITSLPGFFGENYCKSCNKTYTKRDKHKCPQKCSACFAFFLNGKTCFEKEKNKITCKHCNREFFGEECFQEHKQI